MKEEKVEKVEEESGIEEEMVIERVDTSKNEQNI